MLLLYTLVCGLVVMLCPNITIAVMMKFIEEFVNQGARLRKIVLISNRKAYFAMHLGAQFISLTMMMYTQLAS